MTLRRVGPHDPALPAIHGLMHAAFAAMKGRIDPPSSLHRLTVAALTDAAKTSELWVIGAPPIACVLLTPKPEHLYLGKLAVAPHMQGQGLARDLVAHAQGRAVALGLPALMLETRIELVENHAAFAAMGFVKTAETAHAGFTRPTAIVMVKDLR